MVVPGEKNLDRAKKRTKVEAGGKYIGGEG